MRQVGLLIIGLFVLGSVSADTPPEKKLEMLKQAFDGAMTCSALSAVNSQRVADAEEWKWRNRSFAFGMLAARFLGDATNKPVTAESLDEALNQYIQALEEMKPDQVAHFETICQAKYAEVDKLCEENGCPNADPAKAESAQNNAG